MDEIKRKLELIDQQLAQRSYHRQIISTAPLIFVAAGLIAGIVAQNAFNLPVIAWLGLLTLFAAAAVVSFLNWKSEIGNWIFAYLAFACFFCLGGIRLAGYYQPAANDIRNFIGDESQLATVKGTILTEPRVNKNEQWVFAKFTHKDPSSSFYLKLNEAETTTGWAKVTGIIRVQVDEQVLHFKVGDMVQIYCWLDKFKGPHNPGQFDIAEYMKRNNVFVAASAKSRDSIELLNGNSSGLFTKVQDRLKKIAVNALLGGPYPQDQSESLLLALVLGYRTNIDKETYNAFRKTGLLHFVCLSGMNFGIVIGFVWWVCKTAGLMKPGRAIVCMTMALLFLLVVPENAPAFRAAVICFAFCLSFIFRRKSNSFNSLALAAIVLLLIKPTGIFQADWQLSFASVLGILMFCPLFFSLLREKTIDNPWFTDFVKARPLLHITIQPMPYSMFSTSFTAWLSSAGIILYHFHTIQWLTSVWTVIVSPLICLISFLGYLKLFVALFFPTVSAVMGIIINHLSDLLIWIVKLFASLNISEILTGKTNIAVILLFYGLIVFAFFFPLRRPAIKKAICITAALMLIASLAIPWWQRTHGDNLTITVLDVGHGQAVLAQLPGGANILFDAGSLHYSDIGRKIVVPFLNYNGIGTIDAVIISHGDIDHINGIPEIVEYRRIGGVYADDAVFSDTDPCGGPPKVLKTSLAKNGIKIQPLKQNFDRIKILLDPNFVSIQILWPDKQTGNDEKLSSNDKSVVSLIEFAGRKILLCSDIEKSSQKKLIALDPALKADIVVVPHHGSTRTRDKSFLENLNASTLIYSCGRSQYENQHSRRSANSTKSFYTVRDGAITVRIDKNGEIKTAPFLK
jgi:competence protein ComEC